MIRIFFLSQDINDMFINLEPRIPKTKMRGEDGEIPRIGVALTIGSCLSAITSMDVGDKVHVYEAFVENTDLIQPSEDDVPDSFLTGELWLLKDTQFKLVGDLIITGGGKSMKDDTILCEVYHFDYYSNVAYK